MFCVDTNASYHVGKNVYFVKDGVLYLYNGIKTSKILEGVDYQQLCVMFNLIIGVKGNKVSITIDGKKNKNLTVRESVRGIHIVSDNKFILFFTDFFTIYNLKSGKYVNHKLKMSQIKYLPNGMSVILTSSMFLFVNEETDFIFSSPLPRDVIFFNDKYFVLSDKILNVLDENFNFRTDFKLVSSNKTIFTLNNKICIQQYDGKVKTYSYSDEYNSFGGSYNRVDVPGNILSIGKKLNIVFSLRKLSICNEWEEKMAFETEKDIKNVYYYDGVLSYRTGSELNIFIIPKCILNAKNEL